MDVDNMHVVNQGVRRPVEVGCSPHRYDPALMLDPVP